MIFDSRDNAAWVPCECMVCAGECPCEAFNRRPRLCGMCLVGNHNGANKEVAMTNEHLTEIHDALDERIVKLYAYVDARFKELADTNVSQDNILAEIDDEKLALRQRLEDIVRELSELRAADVSLTARMTAHDRTAGGILDQLEAIDRDILDLARNAEGAGKIDSFTVGLAPVHDDGTPFVDAGMGDTQLRARYEQAVADRNEMQAALEDVKMTLARTADERDALKERLESALRAKDAVMAELRTQHWEDAKENTATIDGHDYRRVQCAQRAKHEGHIVGGYGWCAGRVYDIT